MPMSGSLCEALFKYLPDSAFLIDPESANILDCNDAALAQLGMQRDEVLGHSVLSLQADVVGMDQWTSVAQAIRASHTHVFIGQHRHASGAEVPVEVNTRVMTVDGREYFLSVARDLRQRLTLEREQNSRDAQLRYALTEASDGLWDWNLQTDEVFFSPQLARMLGYGPHEMKPDLATWNSNIHPEDAPRVHLIMQEHLDGQRERFEAEYRLRNRNGHYLWLHDRGRVFDRDAQGKPNRIVGMVQNITVQKTNEQSLQYLALRDALTGLPNRRECDRVLEQRLQVCRRLNVPLGMCFFDLDHFKRINDTFGHTVGDQVLLRVAQTVRQAIRSSDDLFRWGGEEFLLLCTNTGQHELLVLVEKLRQKLSHIDWQDLTDLPPITGSFGLAVFPEHAKDATTLFLAADTAMYRAKANGRDRVERATAVAPA